MLAKEFVCTFLIAIACGLAEGKYRRDGILVIGGYKVGDLSPPSTPTAEPMIELFDPQTGSTELTMNTSIQFCEGGYQMQDGRILVIDNFYSADTYYIDLCKNTITNGPTRTIKRDGAASAYANDSALYSVMVCGGDTLGDTSGWKNVLSCEELVGDKWAAAKFNLPTARNRFSLTKKDKSLVAVGGAPSYPNPSVPNLDTVDVVVEGSWTTAEPLNETTGRRSHGAAWYNNMLWICGGIFTDKEVANNSCKTLTRDGKWFNAPSLVFPRASFQLVVYNNELYAVGGGSSSVEKLGADKNGAQKWSILKPGMHRHRNCHCSVEVHVECD